MTVDSRGVSTVFDVTFGLLLLSACTVLLSTNLDSNTETSLNTTEADQTAQTLSTITMEITYQVRIEGGNSSVTYTFTEAGTAAQHLKKAAILNATVDESRFVETNYPQKVNESIRKRFRGSKDNYRIVAQWQPYKKPQARLDGDTPTKPVLYGRASAGIRPAPREDVSSAKLTVESGMDSAETVRTNTAHGGLSKSIAVTVVDGYFPVSETQFAFERGGKRQGYTKSKYKRLALLLATNSSSPYVQRLDGRLNSYAPRVYYLNGLLTGMLQTQIEQDISTVDTEYVRRHITTGRVEITVKTWE